MNLETCFPPSPLPFQKNFPSNSSPYIKRSKEMGFDDGLTNLRLTNKQKSKYARNWWENDKQ